jgi:hypothetical protein
MENLTWWSLLPLETTGVRHRDWQSGRCVRLVQEVKFASYIWRRFRNDQSDVKLSNKYYMMIVPKS